MRTLGLEHASGKFIIVTEDHCVPSLNWLQSFQQAFSASPENVAAVGGCVENAVFDTAFDWATFLCEYSYFLAPVAEGLNTILPGMNVAYKKEVLDSIEPQVLTSGFWETTLHPVLLAKGYQLYSTADIVIYHAKAFSLKLFLQQRFIYSQYYAGLRYRKEEKAKRAIACCATIILPALLTFRAITQTFSKGRYVKQFFLALPYLLLFYIVWSLGEIYGYAVGAGNALNKIE